MLKKMTILILLISFGALAQENSQSTNELSNMLKQFILTSVGPTFPGCSEENVLHIEGTYNQCVKSICQSEDKFENYTEYVDRFIDIQGVKASNVPEEFKMNFLQHMDKYIEQEKTGLAELQKLLPEADLSINPKFKALHHFIYLMGFSDYLDFDVNDEDMVAKGFKESTSEAPVPEFTQAEKEWAIKGINESKMYKGIISLYSDPEQFLKNRWPGLSLAAAVKKQAVATRAELNKLEKDAGPFAKFIEVDLLEQVLNDKDLTKNELPEFLSSVYMTEKVLPVMARPELYPVIHKGIEINLKDLVTKRNVAKNLEQHKAKINNAQIINHSKDDVILNCYVSYLMKELAPAPEEKTKFTADVLQYKKEFKDGLGRLYSTHSAEKLRQVIDLLDFRMPEDKDSFEQNFKFATGKALQDMANDGKDAEALGMDEKTAIQLSLYQYMNPQEEEIFGSIDHACTSGGISPELTDATETVSGKVLVSWQSVRLPLGKGVIFHEMGHNVFSSFQRNSLSTESKKNFNKTVSCLNHLHPEIEGAGEEEGLYTNEDYSDLLSASFNTSKNTQPFACHFVYQVNMGDQTRYVHDPLVNKYEDDPHSSGLFRLLHDEFVSKGALPAACEGYLENTQGKFPIKNCLK